MLLVAVLLVRGLQVMDWVKLLAMGMDWVEVMHLAMETDSCC
jgi:hypothetical protein